MITETDRKHLQRCLELASEALAAGDRPFGSILVSSTGDVLFEDRNRVSGGDQTRHPEFEVARWAAANMAPEERAAATVYTSGEHCSMCAAAHGWVGLGRIVYASSSGQMTQWLSALNVPPSRVRPRPIGEIIRDAEVDGPVEEFADRVHQLIVRYYEGTGA